MRDALSDVSSLSELEDSWIDGMIDVRKEAVRYVSLNVRLRRFGD